MTRVLDLARRLVIGVVELGYALLAGAFVLSCAGRWFFSVPFRYGWVQAWAHPAALVGFTLLFVMAPIRLKVAYVRAPRKRR